MFNLEEIKQRSEPKSYEMGRRLFEKGMVSRLTISDHKVTAVVSGTHDYRVTLDNDNSLGGLHVHCDCPAASYQDVCKHTVAVALCVENPSQVIEATEAESSEETLRAWFSQKPVNELTDIIMSYIERSDADLNKWQLAMRSDNGELDAAELRKMITKALPAKQLYEWNEVARYFEQAERMFDAILPAIEKLPVSQQWQLIYRAIERLNKVLERIDDSGWYRNLIEGELCQRLIALFELQTWSDKKKATWIFEHFKEYKFDLFPAVPEDFTLSDEAKQLFVEMCREELDSLPQPLDYADWRIKSYVNRLIEPLVDQARENGDLGEECRLRDLTATNVRDYLKISDVCLGANSAFDAEHWLQEAYKVAKDSFGKHECRKFCC